MIPLVPADAAAVAEGVVDVSQSAELVISNDITHPVVAVGQLTGLAGTLT